MDGLEIARRRLRNQRLAGPRPTDPVAVVGHLGAVQAQEYAVARWSVGQRTAGCDDAAVQRAVDSGAILRTHALRPTWHFIAAADLGWIQGLTGPRVHRFNGGFYRGHGIDDEGAARVAKVFAQALRGGNHLTRKELGDVLGAHGIDATGSRLAAVVMWAELDGLIASGVMRGKQHTYALVSERVPEPRELTGDAALAELTRRYFTSHGPATVRDFSWWSSLTVTQIRRGLELVGAELASEEVAGRRYWFAPAGPPPGDPSPTAHVLQAYDETVVGYTESRAALNVADLPLRILNENMLLHPILIDSQLVGFWRRTAGPRQITAGVHLATDLSGRQRRAVAAAFARYGGFAGVPVTVAWPLAPYDGGDA